MFDWDEPVSEPIRSALFERIGEAAFPCVGAKAAMVRGTLETLGARSLASAWDDVRIHDRLLAFATSYRTDPGLFQSFAVIFDGPDDIDEGEFEALLWTRIQSLSDKDVWRGQSYDGAVSADPDNPHFSLSFGGEAFFIIGLHPRSSRPARRFERPMMVFNLHDQFVRLRAEGRYETMREKILVRDEALAGSRNPMLARHGEISEGRQYSGRSVDEDWKCPFGYKGRV